MSTDTSPTPIRSAPSANPDQVIPDFEGNIVTSTKAKVTGSASLDVNDQVFRVDQVVRMVVEARVDGVGHDVANDGQLVRVHRMKVIDSIVLDWQADLETLRAGLA